MEKNQSTQPGEASAFRETVVMPRITNMWEHAGWGDSIYWSDYEQRRVTGHMTPIPKEGDLLRCVMGSGKIAEYKFEKVDQMDDPRDQFFATMSDIGYVA